MACLYTSSLTMYDLRPNSISRAREEPCFLLSSKTVVHLDSEDTYVRDKQDKRRQAVNGEDQK